MESDVDVITGPNARCPRRSIPKTKVRYKDDRYRIKPTK